MKNKMNNVWSMIKDMGYGCVCDGDTITVFKFTDDNINRIVCRFIYNPEYEKWASFTNKFCDSEYWLSVTNMSQILDYLNEAKN